MSPSVGPNTNWSKVGKRSRRKGKVYERKVAALLREATGVDWQTTRNSGRTDLKGDVYCLESRRDEALVECKDREYWTIANLMKGSVRLVGEINGLVEMFLQHDEYEVFLLFINAKFGSLVGVLSKGRRSEWKEQMLTGTERFVAYSGAVRLPFIYFAKDDTDGFKDFTNAFGV